MSKKKKKKKKKNEIIYVIIFSNFQIIDIKLKLTIPILNRHWLNLHIHHIVVLYFS